MIIGKCLHEKCARNRNRTGTTVRSRDFKSLVSTYFTIRAEGEHYTCVTCTPLGVDVDSALIAAKLERKKGKCITHFPFVLEREKSIELSTYTLARYRSTN